MRPEDLEAVLDAHDVAGCIAMFEKATEQERRALAKPAAERLRAAIADFPRNLLWGLHHHPEENLVRHYPFAAEKRPAIRVAQVAVIATATLAELKSLCNDCLPTGEDAVAVLSARRPPWVQEWADWVLSRDNHIGWMLVRGLVRAGLCERPPGPRFIEGIVRAIPDHRRFHGIREALLDDPGLLDGEIFELFELEPQAGSLCLFLTFPKMPPEQRWDLALAGLVEEGKISRTRLLDASLGGIERDFHEVRTKEFVGIHEALRPTLDERAARAGRYAGLLASRNPSTVTFALKALAALDRAGRLDPRLIVEAIGPALLARAKGTARDALELIDHAAGRDAGIRGRAAIAAVDAMVHESPAVQEAALDLIERHGDRADATLADLLRARAEGVAASQRGRLVSWLSAAEPAAATHPAADGFDDLLARASALPPDLAERTGVTAAVEVLNGGGSDVPAAVFDETDAPRLDPDRAIVPVQDLDELIRPASAMLERPDDADEIERLLDGISRLCDRRPPDFEARTAPLAARAERAQEWVFPRADALRGLILSWVTAGPRTVADANLQRYLVGFHGRRVQALARRAAAGQAAPMLGAPTHRGGWIDPRVLVDRVKIWASLPFRSDRLDASVALLRLAPDPGPRAEALRSAEELRGPYASALRHALGGDGETVGPDARIWVAAARARAPREDDPLVEARHPGLGPDAGRAAQCSLRPGPYPGRREDWRWKPPFLLVCEPPLPPSRPDDLPTVLFHDHRARRSPVHQPWDVSLWPLGRESFFAAGLESILQDEGSPTIARMYRGFPEALLDPDVPLGPMARLLLAATLSAKSPELHGVAVDALIAAVDDGRIDGRMLGEAVRRLLAEGLAMRSRLARTLADAARVSPLHARVIVQALQIALIVPDDPARDLHIFLEPLKELLIETGETVSDPAVRDFLAGQKGSSKTAKLAREILGLSPHPERSRCAAAARALAGRLDRAERWLRVAVDATPTPPSAATGSPPPFRPPR